MLLISQNTVSPEIPGRCIYICKDLAFFIQRSRMLYPDLIIHPNQISPVSTMANKRLFLFLGIVYCNGAGASSEAVADMALFHIISVFRNMTWSHLAARSGDPQKFRHAHDCVPILSHNPRGHTLGVVGLGNIGFAIAKKVHAALGMKIIYHDIKRKAAEQENEVQARFYPRLQDMLPVTDCLLVAAPFSGQTLITAPVLNALEPGARFVNVGRGSLVDEDAVADALESGHLCAIGLDVHAHEPNVSARLRNNWKVTVTSHTGGGAFETNVGFERLVMENVERVLLGGEPLTAVNLHLLRRRGENGRRKKRLERL